MSARFTTKKMVTVALLIALNVLLTRFCAINTLYVKIGLGFVPIAVCAILYGPVWAGVAGGMADFLGAILFPIGAYFPGFTFSAALTGIVFGLFLQGNDLKPQTTLYAVGVNCIVISLFLNTYWLSYLYSASFQGLLITRMLQNCIMFPIQFIMIRVLRRLPLHEMASG
jgi:ECF transporter S component (folate family)